MERTLLLVDDEENIVRSLVRLLRRDGYKILTANSGKQGLEVLKQNEVGVILSDQRMPEMSGSEFLGKVKELYPDTVRLVLSGYTDLTSVTDAINRGAIYRFLTKPWDDELLRANIEEAFQYQELTKENTRLTSELKRANELLEGENRDLVSDLEEKMEVLQINLRALEISQEILEQLPVAVLGIGDDGMVAVANIKAHQYLKSENSGLVGRTASEILPPELARFCQIDKASDAAHVQLFQLEGGRTASVYCNRLSGASDGKGSILVLSENR